MPILMPIINNKRNTDYEVWNPLYDFIEKFGNVEKKLLHKRLK